MEISFLYTRTHSTPILKLYMDFLKEITLALKSMALQRNPGSINLIFDIVRIAGTLEKNQKSMKQIETSLLANSEFKEMWQSRWLPSPPTKEMLRQMPVGSVGNAYLKHLESNNLKPDFYKTPKIKSVIDYLSYRLYNVHDIWHSILSYDISVIGELEVQAFTLGQMDSPISVYLITGGLYNILRTSPETSKEAFDRISQAYERGKKAKFLLSFKLEERLSENLASVQSEMMII